MMVPRGHEVFIYGTTARDHKGEHVHCYPNKPPPAFTPEEWHPYNQVVIEKIRERAEPEDFVCLIGGLAQAEVCTELPYLSCEFGIGYGGSIPYHPRVFESYAWMHATYGMEAGNDRANGNFYDAVIPGYFDPVEFPIVSKKEDYILFVGRLIERKGVEIACEIAKQLNKTLLIAGEGDFQPEGGTYLGKVGPEERASLMSKASALIAPTTYLEPFGFVAIEAMLCGTPVITTDWGAFTETVPHALAGYRCRTLGEFCWAVENVGDLDPEIIASYARNNYSYKKIAPRYEAYFNQLNTLREQGWYTDWEGISNCRRYK